MPQGGQANRQPPGVSWMAGPAGPPDASHELRWCPDRPAVPPGALHTLHWCPLLNNGCPLLKHYWRPLLNHFWRLILNH